MANAQFGRKINAFLEVFKEYLGDGSNLAIFTDDSKVQPIRECMRKEGRKNFQVIGISDSDSFQQFSRMDGKSRQAEDDDGEQYNLNDYI